MRFYKFQKEVNSTAVPGENTISEEFQCEALDGMSLANPVIKVLLPMTARVHQYNYMYVSAFNRFYWIQDWSYRDRCWQVLGAVDALGTFRGEIGGISAYVLRSAHEYDGTIQDNFYPAKAQWSGSAVSYPSGWLGGGFGYYSVGVIGSGQTSFYIMGQIQLMELLDWMLSDEYAASVITGLGLAAYPEAKAILDPLQYITSIVFLPIDVSSSNMQTHTIKVGYAEYDLQCWMVSVKEAQTTTKSITLPKHPNASSRGMYLNAAPYSSYALFYPPFGLISLDPALCAVSSTITATINMDLQTGDATLIITDTTGRVMSRTGAKVGCPIQLSQVIAPGYGILSAARDASGIASGIASAAFGGDVAGGISTAVNSVFNGIGNAISGSIPSANTIGSIGTVDAIKGDIQMQAMFAMPVADDLTHRGRPLCQVRMINTLPGYLLCADVDIHILGATSEEMDIIKQSMESGFYYA